MALTAPSALPGWDRLTVVVHLRYGAEASLRLTDDALAGRRGAFYPGGRDNDRPATLRPREGEDPTAVVASMAAVAERLDRRWARLSATDWQAALREPEGAVDLGTIDLALLALLRATEVEVHGRDLDLDPSLVQWDPRFVAIALPARLHWLARRRSNRPADVTIDGRWCFRPDDGPAIEVASNGGRVTVGPPSPPTEGPEPRPVGSAPGGPVDRAVDTDGRTESVELRGTSADLLAFVLGRAPVGPIDVGGDEAEARRFTMAFPPP